MATTIEPLNALTGTGVVSEEHFGHQYAVPETPAGPSPLPLPPSSEASSDPVSLSDENHPDIAGRQIDEQAAATTALVKL